MLVKKYGMLFTFTMSLLTTTPLFAPPGDGTDDVSTTSTRSLPSEDTELTPGECNRRFFSSEETLESTVVDIALAKASAILTPVLDSLSDPKALAQDASHAVADAVIKN